MISSQETKTRGLLFHGISSMLGDLARGVIKSNSRVGVWIRTHLKVFGKDDEMNFDEM